jgi:hypothetical protein
MIRISEIACDPSIALGAQSNNRAQAYGCPWVRMQPFKLLTIGLER